MNRQQSPGANCHMEDIKSLRRFRLSLGCDLKWDCFNIFGEVFYIMWLQCRLRPCCDINKSEHRCRIDGSVCPSRLRSHFLLFLLEQNTNWMLFGQHFLKLWLFCLNKAMDQNEQRWFCSVTIELSIQCEHVFGRFMTNNLDVILKMCIFPVWQLWMENQHPAVSGLTRCICVALWCQKWTTIWDTMHSVLFTGYLNWFLIARCQSTVIQLYKKSLYFTVCNGGRLLQWSNCIETVFFKAVGLPVSGRGHFSL